MSQSLPAAQIDRFISGSRVFLISDAMTMPYLCALIKKRNAHTNGDEILVKFDPIPNRETTHTLYVTLLNLITYEHHDDDDPW